MSHPIYRVRSVEVVAPFTLQLRFDDGTERRIDFSSILAGELYGPLRDIALFNQVRIDPEVRCRRRGRDRLYSLRSERLRLVRRWVSHFDAFWTDRLTRLGRGMRGSC